MKVLITSTVEHDGERLPLDKVVDLPDEVAQALIDAQAAELPAKRKAADDGEKA